MSRKRSIAALLASLLFGAGGAFAQQPGPGYVSPGPAAGGFSVSGPPATPTFPSRPEGWPGGRSNEPRVANLPPRNVLPPGQSNVRIIEPLTIIARVGSEVVLASDLLPAANDFIAEAGEKVDPQQADMYRLAFIKQTLQRDIDRKVLIIEARTQIPKENQAKVEDNLKEEFEKSSLPRLLDAYKVKTRGELDAKLRTLGTSLDAKKRTFNEQVMATQWLQSRVKMDEEVTHEQMLAYYKKHAADYELKAKARYEILTVKFEKYPSMADAYRQLAQFGNQISAGAPLAELAKQHSDDPSADDGGLCDWIGRGSLASDVLDQAIFSLPVGTLSRILQDERGFHIVRVVERTEQTRKAFTDVQAEIKDKVRKERRVAAMTAYIAKMRAKTPVWSIFDEEGVTLQLAPQKTAGMAAEQP